MGDWIVTFARIDNLRQRFVGGELKSREWYRHSEGRRVGDVESSQSLIPVDVPCTLRY